MVYSQVLQNIAKRIKDAYTGFYARRKAGLKAGLPARARANSII